MDFIKALPKSEGKDTIMMVVGRLIKYTYFISLTHSYTAQEIARAFLDTIYKLYEMSQDIISHRNKIFTS